MDQFINILVTVTLIKMMAAIGLGVTFREMAGVARNWRLVAQAALANYVFVPAITVGLLFLLHAQPMVAAGFLILAVCPGAPFGPPCAKIAKGDVAAAVGLMVLLAGSSAIAAPVLLQLLLPLVSDNETLQVDSIKIVASLLVTQLLPLLIGLGLRHWRPGLATKLQRPANLISALLSLVAVVVILFVHFQMLSEIRLSGYIGMTVLLIGSWAAGWLLGGPGSGLGKSMALTTSLRNVGVGLVIAAGSFAGTPAVTAVVAYGILEIAGSLLLALAWGRAETKVKVPDQKLESSTSDA